MMIKKTILAACIAVVAPVALPTVAPAEEEATNPGDPYLEGVTAGTKFTAAGGEAKLTGAPGTVKCKKNSATGEFENPETGSIKLIFEECTSPIGTACTTSGSSSGKITTTTLPFHLKTVEHGGVKKSGILITPGANNEHGPHFFTFECGFVGKIEVGGNGLVGTITSPGEGVASNEATISFSSTEAGSTTQTHRKVLNDETEYDLKSRLNGAETKTAAANAADTIKLAEAMKPTLRTTPPGEEEEEGGEVTNHPGDPLLEGVTAGTQFTATGWEERETFAFGTLGCKKSSASGEFFDPETGSIKLTFEECGPPNARCTTPGSPSGTITTTTLPFHLKTVEHEGEEKPGILITPGANNEHGPHFATFSCVSVGTFEVGGNGLLGTITNPGEGVASNELTISFSSAAAGSTTQTHRKVINDETEYDLKARTSGGETKTTALDFEETIQLAEGMEPTLRTTPLE